MPGFSFRRRESGGAPTIKKVLAKNTATYTKGDLVTLTSGEAVLTATGDTNILGVVLATKEAKAGVTQLDVVTDADAVYGVTDANARAIGATLDIAGATGAQGVAASSNKEFVVTDEKLASEETLVRINTGKHWTKAQ